MAWSYIWAIMCLLYFINNTFTKYATLELQLGGVTSSSVQVVLWTLEFRQTFQQELSVLLHIWLNACS